MKAGNDGFMEPEQSTAWVRQVRFVVGIVLPASLLALVVVTAAIQIESPTDIEALGSGVMFSLVLLSPFPLYYFVIRSTPFTVIVGIVLLGVTGWAIYFVLASTGSLAGLAFLWIPVIGAPLVVICSFIEWVAGVR